jgi:hypothetical protein
MKHYVFYRSDNKIIALSTYAGKTVKGYAKCSPEDEFSNETGKQLAAARCGVKVAVKRVKNAQKKWHEAVQAYLKAEKHMHAMAKYYEDAVDRQKIAEAQVEYILNEIKEG